MENFDVPPKSRSLEMEPDDASPGDRYFSIQQDQFTITVTIPVRRSLALIFFSFTWGFVCSAGFLATVSAFFYSFDFRLLIPAFITAFFACFGILEFLQQVSGKSIVHLRNDEMELTKCYKGRSASMTFLREDVRDLKVIREIRDSDGASRYGFDRFSFSYFGKTHSFGYSADFGTADEIHSFFCARLPNAGPQVKS